MSGVEELHVFQDTQRLGEELARALGLSCRPVEVHSFPDGESLVRVHSEGAGQALLLRSLDHPNPKILEVLLAADALHRQGVKRLALVAPYLCYMRQDRAFRAGEAISQHVVGALFGNAFERVCTIEAHLHRISRLQDVIPCEAQSISAAPLIGEWCCTEQRFDLVVGPDAESEPWVRAIAEAAALPFVVGEKVRSGDREVQVELPPIPSGVGEALIVDDIVSSGATMASVARKLKACGVQWVEAVVVHALFGQAVEKELQVAGIDRLLSTDTVSHPSNAISTASLLARQFDEDAV